jgi:hypothetical protein
MNAGASDHFAKAGMALDIAVIAIAVPFIFLPEIRNPTMKTIVWTIFMLHCGLSTYIAWKTGMLSKTPRQIYDTIRESGPPRRRRFEGIALFLGFVAFALGAWW